MIAIAFKLLGALALLIYGMKIMSVRGRFGTYSKEGTNDSCVAIYYEPMAAYECKVIPIIIDPKSLAAFLDEVRRAAQILGVDAG